MGDDTAAYDDGGLNRHEELVIFSCVAVVFVMSITIVLFLWYIVDRTKSRISNFELHLPNVVNKFRQEIIELGENDHSGRVMMAAGTLGATEEFEGVHPLDVNCGRVRLTSYTRKQDVSIGTDFPENQARASNETADAIGDEPNAVREEPDAAREEPDAAREEPTRRISSKAVDGAESHDFVYIDGEYISKEFLSLERCPPPYAYDNPAYDNPYTENGDTANILRQKPTKGKRIGKKNSKNKSKFSVYESHV